MRKYISMMKINFLMNIQYRAAAYAGMTTQFFWGFMTIIMFRAFYESNPNSFPMEFGALSSYIWLQQAFLALFYLYLTDNTIFQSIIDGNVAYELCRPVDLYTGWIVKNMGARMSRAALRCLPIIIFASFLPKPYGLTVSLNIETAVLFLPAFVLAFTVTNAMAMMIYISAFYTVSPMGVRLIIISASDFLTGGIIPLPFFPPAAQKVAELLPFGSMQNVPLRIFTGDIPAEAALPAILLQAFWAFALVLLGRLSLRSALRRVVIQGG